MSNYNDNWKAFVDETKEMSDEQLQEYVGDIARAISGLFGQSGEGGKKSHLSGLGSAGEVAASDKRKKDAAAKKAAQLRAMPTINIFKGKQGKGIQSQLARAGLDEKTANIILKALQKDFAEAGYNVMENAARKVIALANTLQIIEALTDPVKKEKVKEIIVNMLRQNKIKLDPQSSKALRSAAVPVNVEEVPDFDGETGIPITDEGRDKLLDLLSEATTKEQFNEIYNRLLQSKYGIANGKDPDAIKSAIENNDPMRISTFGNTEEEKRIAVRRKFIDLFLQNRAQRRAAARGEKGSSKDSARPPEVVAKKRAADIKRRKAQKKARKKNRRREHIEIDQENTELISESVIKQWQKLIGTI